MRKELCNSLVARVEDPNTIFLTGDLGFMALEPLQKALGPRFINAGVAEQNMVSVAAALAKDGWATGSFEFTQSSQFVFTRTARGKRMGVLWSSDFPRAIGGWGRWIGKIHRMLCCEPLRES
jgi:transketolase C-terminal domain/subunit